MSDFSELGSHAATGGGVAALVLAAAKFFGGRQVKQLDETLAALQGMIKDNTKALHDQDIKLAVMGEQLSTLIAEKAVVAKLSERLALLEAAVEAIHIRRDEEVGRRK